LAENILLGELGLNPLAVEEFHRNSGDLDSIAQLNLFPDVPNPIPILFVITKTITCPEIGNCHLLSTQVEVIFFISAQLLYSLHESYAS